MATEQHKRRNVLLAILLALIAAGTLCVWGAAAAGLTFSSPVLDAFIDAITVSPEERAANGGGTGGGGGDVIPPTGGDGSGDGDGDGSGNDDGGGGGGGGGGSTGENCLLGILCLNVDASVNTNGSTGANGSGAGGSVDGSAGDDNNCFLGLICLNAKVDATTNDTLDSDTNAILEADEDGVRLDADADADTNADEENCLLGLVCLNLNSDVNAVASTSTQAGVGATLQSWWDSFVSLFVSAEAQS